MFITRCKVESVKKLAVNIYLLKAYSPEIASDIKPGEFCNIKVSESNFPLLRRPFSICDVEGEYIYFMFNVHGEGTRYLAEKKEGDVLDILAPLGKGFNVEGDFKTTVIVAGGIGAAPFPMLTKLLVAKEKKVITLMGGRNQSDLTDHGMINLDYATDDGSKGFCGNVVELFKSKIEGLNFEEIKVFGCGPNPMLKALKEFCEEKDIQCEISTECAMACGFGICQGCPIESTFNGEKYLLVCKDGPVFNSKDVIL